MPDEVVQTPFGKFLIDPQDLIGSTLKAGTLWDGPGFLQPIAVEHGRLGEVGTTILDIGANQGAFSVWLASRGAWRVVAVEPIPQVMQRLKANLDLNKDTCADRVVTLEIAAYDRSCLLLADPLDPGNLGGTALWPDAPHDERHTIQGQPLDNYEHLFGQRVSLIKVDAQGCDGRALRGLERTICRQGPDKPVLVFEWETDLAKRHDDRLADLLRWLEFDCGYRVSEWPSHPNNFLALPLRSVRT